MSTEAVKKTRTAYRETFVDQVNQYGEKRGLVVEKLVLRDKDSGKQLEVNAERPRTYDELNDDERNRVKMASRWKDQHRVSDRGQSTLGHVGKMPAASHVKQYEKKLNQEIGEIHTVNVILVVVVAVVLTDFIVVVGHLPIENVTKHFPHLGLITLKLSRFIKALTGNIETPVPRPTDQKNFLNVSFQFISK